MCPVFFETPLNVGGHKMDHLAINSTIAVAGKAGFTLQSAATAAVEFKEKWLNLCPRTVFFLFYLFRVWVFVDF